MLNVNDYKKLSSVIYRRTGIDLDIKRYNSLKPKIEALIQKYGYNDFRSFFHDYRFDKNKDIKQELLNVITINETYFFRENYQFEALVNDVLYTIAENRHKTEVIRILCAPSSTGEEPYSIVLSLLEENNFINERDVEIIGIDIDSNVIKKAENGIYSKRSVQYVPPHLLDNYFIQKNNTFEIIDMLKNVVEFKTVNVMDKFSMKKLGKFDVIFSRNMLIYFDDESRKKVALTFYEMLKPGGVVFLGHAESMSRIVSIFKTAKSGKTIYYIKS